MRSYGARGAPPPDPGGAPRSEMTVLTPDLRRVDPAESDVVADLWFTSRRANAPAIPPAVHSYDEVREWMRETVCCRMDVWLAQDERRRPLAMMALDGPTVDQLYVAPEATGRGVGSRLLALAKSGHTALELWTFQSNRRAIGFYEHHGFRSVRRTDGENEERSPDILLRWTR